MSEMLHVRTGGLAFVSSAGGSPWGGSEELWSQAALWLARAGHRVAASVAYWEELHPNLGALIEAGVSLHRRKWPATSLARRVFSRLRNITYEQKTEAHRRAWLKRTAPALVCISQGGSDDGLEWMETCQATGIPYLIISHSIAPSLWPADAAATRLRQACLGARACLFVSRISQEIFEDQVGAALPRALIVHNPFRVSYETALPWPQPAGEWRLGCVGRIDPGTKGQDILLHVLASEKWKQRALKLVFYGEGPSEQSVLRLRDRLGVEHARFAGHVDDIQQVWRENHALIMPSRVESMPLALVEAMLCARPALVTNVGGMTELVHHGVNGFVAPAPTLPCLDETLELAWQLRNDWERLGQCAAETVRAAIPPDPVAIFCRLLLELHGSA